MRGPLAAAVVVAAFLVLVALVELGRDRRRAKRGRVAQKAWWRRMGRFFGGYPVPAIAGWGSLVKVGGPEATIGELALLWTIFTVSAAPGVLALPVFFKRRFGIDLPEAGDGDLYRPWLGMTREMVWFMVIGVLAVIGAMTAAVWAVDAAGWLDVYYFDRAAG